MKALLFASLLASTMVLHAGPKSETKKTPAPKKNPAPVVKAEPVELKSGVEPDGRVIITSADLARSGSSTLAGALRHSPYLFIRGR